MREGLFDDFAQLVAVVRQPEIVSGAHFESPDFVLGKIADDEIEAIEVVTTDCLCACTGHDYLMTEACECLFENTQLIVIIHDENPAFFHQAPIYTGVQRRDNYRRLYENLSPRVRNISRTALS